MVLALNGEQPERHAPARQQKRAKKIMGKEKRSVDCLPTRQLFPIFERCARRFGTKTVASTNRKTALGIAQKSLSPHP